MYSTYGGVSTYFHLAVKHPLLVFILFLVGFTAVFGNQASGGPGNALGTDHAYTVLEHRLLQDNPQLGPTVAGLQQQFDSLAAEPTEEQVKYVLGYTDAATDIRPKDILADPALKRDVAWLYFLDVYGRDGPQKALALWPARAPAASPPPRR